MPDRLLSRADVLGGLPARRAATALHAIRSRTASLVVHSRRPLGGYVGPRTSAERESEFLAALATDRDARAKPTIQDLERYATEWAVLVPPHPALRAAIAERLGAEHAFTPSRVPRLRGALGLDEPDVRAAFEGGTSAPLESIYASTLSLRERLRWRRARLAERLERMPPFWIAFALTLTEAVGAGILALPVALAGVGPIGAVVLIAIFGLVNVLTVGALAEAIVRTGSMRYGASYFDRLVRDHLGGFGAGFVGVALFALNGVCLLVALIGFGAVLSGLVGLSLWVWASLLLAVNLWLLARERLDATIASALVIGAVNIALILALSGLALGHLRGENLDDVRVPLVDGRPVDTGMIVLIFGVVGLTFFGHTVAAHSAKVVLERDPTGRALVWGNIAAFAAAAFLYALTAFAFTAALDRGDLQGSDGTALEPLAAQSGLAVDIIGSVFAVLAIGMGSVYASLGLYSQAVEWRPQRDAARRFAVGAAPAVALFALTMWMVASGHDSFADPLGFVGALTVPLLAGILPMVLVVAARRRGELVPGAVPRVLGHPVTAAAICVLFLAGVVVHGAVIWDDPFERVAAYAVGVGLVAVVAVAWRRGAFRKRVVVEVRREPERNLGYVGVTAAGAGLPFRVELDGRAVSSGRFERFSGVREAKVVLPADAPDETSVWLHRVFPDGDSADLPADIDIVGRVVRIRMRTTGGS